MHTVYDMYYEYWNKWMNEWKNHLNISGQFYKYTVPSYIDAL